jgi:hypothetical protein
MSPHKVLSGFEASPANFSSQPVLWLSDCTHTQFYLRARSDKTATSSHACDVAVGTVGKDVQVVVLDTNSRCIPDEVVEKKQWAF